MTQYGRLCTQFYALDKPEAPADALDFYLQYAKRCDGPILEPMCGTGRFLLPLLARGFDIEGTDLSPDMLGLCRDAVRAAGLHTALHLGRLEELTLERHFGLVLIPSGSFSLLTDGAVVRSSLERIHAALRPGGTFVVEVERAGMIQPTTSGTWEGRWLRLEDGSTLILSWLQQYSGVQGVARSIHRYELVQDGHLVATEVEDFAVKHYEPEAFESLLRTAGFTDIRCLQPYSQEPPDEADEGLVFECRRP
jgi:SAM-dependent methyltransferase